MPFDPTIHHRRSIRLPDFDYANSGAYFVTLVTQGRACLLSRIMWDPVEPTAIGQIAEEEWVTTARMRDVDLGNYILMPNHLHGVLVLRSNGQAGDDDRMRVSGPRKASLGALIGGYKAAVTKRCRAIGAISSDGTLWQRNYYERIIRNDEEWQAIDAYISENPRSWAQDSENPDPFAC